MVARSFGKWLIGNVLYFTPYFGEVLFQKALADPFETVPAADEDEAADVFVEGEDEPHRHKTPAQRDAEKVTL